MVADYGTQSYGSRLARTYVQVGCTSGRIERGYGDLQIARRRGGCGEGERHRGTNVARGRRLFRSSKRGVKPTRFGRRLVNVVALPIAVPVALRNEIDPAHEAAVPVDAFAAR